MTAYTPDGPKAIDERILKQIFDSSNGDALTTNAKLWFLPDEAKVLRTLYLQGNVSLNLNGSVRNYENGAYVYLNQKPGGVSQLEAAPSSMAHSDGITVNGDRAIPAWTNRLKMTNEGNVATLSFEERQSIERTKMLVTMPRQVGPAF